MFAEDISQTCLFICAVILFPASISVSNILGSKGTLFVGRHCYCVLTYQNITLAAKEGVIAVLKYEDLAKVKWEKDSNVLQIFPKSDKKTIELTSKPRYKPNNSLELY